MPQKTIGEYIKTQKKFIASPTSPMKRGHQSVGTHNHRAFRQLIVVLFDSLKIVPRRISLANCSRGEVHYLVTVTAYVSVKFCHAKVRPISTDHREHMSKGVRPYRGDDGKSASSHQRRVRPHFVIVPSMSETTIMSE